MKHQYFLAMAKLAATRSTCNSRPTGAVLVKDKNIIATGYNGSVPGAPHCSEQPDVNGEPYCYRRVNKHPEEDKYNYCRSSHAEANAIAFAARQGISVQGAALYVTLAPCYVCMKLLAVAGIKHVFFELPYRSSNPCRDSLWAEQTRLCGFETVQQVLIDANTVTLVVNSIKGLTSVRRISEQA